MEKEVIKVAQTNESLIRDAVKKKRVQIYGLKEERIPLKIKRDKEEVRKVKELLIS